MKRILVALDLSGRSRRALRRGVGLARQFGAEVTALHVADDDLPDEMVAAECRSAEAAIGEQLEAAGAKGLAPEPAIVARAGDPFRTIADEADRIEADLIVMGAHRKRLLGDMFTGTTIERVMRVGGRPVLMVNTDSEAPYGNVLAAVDLSDASANAVQTARRLGLLEPAHGTVVHGFIPLGEGMMYYAGVERERVDEHVTASAAEARAAIRAFLRNIGVEELADVLLIEKGGPFEAIENGVATIRPDLVVIGTRGHSGLKQVLLGSVASQVLRKIECDILAVPPVRAVRAD